MGAAHVQAWGVHDVGRAGVVVDASAQFGARRLSPPRPAPARSKDNGERTTGWQRARRAALLAFCFGIADLLDKTIPVEKQGVSRVDWQERATLARKLQHGAAGRAGKQREIGEGPLAEIVGLFTAYRADDRQHMRLTLASGRQLDGDEIWALSLRPDFPER